MEKEHDIPADPAMEREPETRRAREIQCAECRSVVTHDRFATAVNGKHTHELVNPSGVAFRVAVFREAEGCVTAGDAQTFFTWFAGHSWRIALCRGCGTHLGWHFEGDSAFFGLIRDKIVEAT
ncbi:MAG: hypothetical protein HYV09_12715 [Deltaproteobacteria bacterium]|nr:hypothetical protein [Deltaproteobacteria bacterium]